MQQKPVTRPEEIEHKRTMANLAYQQWLYNKRLEEKQKKRENRIDAELEALHEKQVKVEQQKAEIAYYSWKRHKEDLEKAVKCEREKCDSRKQTPTLPGYCSVWSCDEEQANHMLSRVYRKTN